MRYGWHEGRWVPKHEMPAPVRHGEGPMLIRDHMAPLVHPVTGKMMDSKAAFRAVTKEHGLTEVGTETTRDTRHLSFSRSTEAEVSRALDQLGDRS